MGLTQANMGLTTSRLIIRTLITHSTSFISNRLLTFRCLSLSISQVQPSSNFNKFSLQRRMTLILMRQQCKRHFKVNLLTSTRALIRQLLIMHITLISTRRTLRIINFMRQITSPQRITSMMFITFQGIRISNRPLITSQVSQITSSHNITMTFQIMRISRRILIILMITLIRFNTTRRISTLLIHLLRDPTRTLILRLLITHRISLTSLSFIFTISRRNCISRLQTRHIINSTHQSLHITRTLLKPMNLSRFLILISSMVQGLTTTFRLRLFRRIFLLTLQSTFRIPIISTQPLFRRRLRVRTITLSLNSSLRIQRGPLTPRAQSNIYSRITQRMGQVTKSRPNQELRGIKIRMLRTIGISITSMVRFLHTILPRCKYIFQRYKLNQDHNIDEVLLLNRCVHTTRRRNDNYHRCLARVVRLFGSGLGFVCFADPGQQSHQTCSSVTQSGSSSIGSNRDASKG